ncbi:MAG: guanylate kinase [Piscirickettsiaceae bacterium]|nr:MAG: guanylate kinase [Piscirickettsiaceae bacterium]
MTSKGQLFIISAPSGAGKTSLVKALLNSLTLLEVSVSYTTRKQRFSEQAGQDYNFITTTEFESMVRDGGFLEHAEVFGNYYGTSTALVENKLNNGVDVILEIDWQGAQQVRRAMQNCCSIFILPPSKQVLEERLRGRGQDSEDVIAQRMQAAVDEMSHYVEYDFVVINDDFDTALQQLNCLIKSQRLATNRINDKQKLIKELLN